MGCLIDSIQFEKRVAKLYFVGSKTLGNTILHLGLSISDLRIRTKHAETGLLFYPSPEEAENSDKNYINKNIFSPLAGIQVQVNPQTMMMVEFQYLPEYNFDQDSPEVSKNEINAVGMVIAGLRFFILDWLPIDTGVLYRTDYHGIGDIHIHAGVNINISLPRVFSK